MSIVAKLLKDIAAFCEEQQIAEATFGTRAVNDGKFVRRLREGADVNVGTVDRVYAYMANARKAA